MGMAYLGSTASAPNPPIRIGGVVGGVVNTASTGSGGGQLWLWDSSNGTTDALAANYFSDAKRLGMRKGDVVIMVGCTGSTVGLVIGVLGAVTTDGACIATTGSFISSTFG